MNKLILLLLFTFGCEKDLTSSDDSSGNGEDTSDSRRCEWHGEWINYILDIVLYAGQEQHLYHTSLGHVVAGEHSIQFKFDDEKSSSGANLIAIESIELIDIATIDVDEDALKHSPILYGRDLLSWNESTHTDVPLIMWHNISQEVTNKRITYSIIFSNEDSRIGVGLADLMYNYGRTTDIEWM